MINGWLSTLWRRIALGTLLWIIYWPILWFIRIGDITGPKAWFWIIGELNYPFALAVFLFTDSLLVRFYPKPVAIFLVNLIAVGIFMYFFYPARGFSFGVLAEAFLF